MSVDYNFTKIENCEQLHSDELEWGKTQALLTGDWSYGIFDIIGMGKITEENSTEVWARLAITQGLVGAFLRYQGEPLFYTKGDITRRIGLSSNYPTRTRTEFFKRIKPLMDTA